MRRIEEDRLTSLNLSSSSVKATMIARERATACLTLSALSSISICFSMESTREPRSSALGGEEGGGEEGGGGERRRRKEEEEEGGGGGRRRRKEEEEEGGGRRRKRREEEEEEGGGGGRGRMEGKKGGKEGV